MTILSALKNFVSETEADVLTIITDIKKGAVVFESDVANGLKWVANNEPVIVADIESILSMAGELGVTSNPEVAAVAAGAQTAIAALQAITKDVSSGANTAQTLVDGVVAVKTAQAAVATAAAQVAQTPAVTAAAATK